MSSHHTIASPVPAAAKSRVRSAPFGKLKDGAGVDVFTLENASGCSCKVMTYGASLTELHIPDRHGKMADVILGYPKLDDYVKSDGYFGATIGRVANRIANAKFSLAGQIYRLYANDGKNHLHGGMRGFDKVIWRAKRLDQPGVSRLVLTHSSPDGDEGYPGNLSASVCYTLTDDNELSIEYEATTDKSTPVNLTNHTYFNLAGRGNILEHLLTLAADRHTPLNGSHLPIGTILPVKQTVADFRSPVELASRLGRSIESDQAFNFSYVLNSGGAAMAFAARVRDPESGRSLDLWTDQPGLQLYTGAYLRPVPRGKNDAAYGPNSGVCLETQNFPDAVNQKHFPSVILEPGEKYRHKTVWKFSAI